jgi:hypothetical protein
MCWKCGHQDDVRYPVEFRALCPSCGKELHVCKNCKFYSPGAYRDCSESAGEAVTDKERSNLCEYFRPSPKLFGGGSGGKPGGNQGGGDAKKKFDSLFGN